MINITTLLMDYTRVVRIPQYFRNLQRLGEIVRVLAKHGFGEFIQRLDLVSYLGMVFPFVRREEPSTLDTGARLRLVCEDLGPTFIKFAQLATTRPDVFPENLLSELRKLQDRAAAFPAEQARKIICEELGCKIEDVFSSFDDNPIGAASIAQVHKGTLSDGKKIVVKVQRPDIDKIVDVDTDILKGLAELVDEKIPESRLYNFPLIVDEFSRSIKAECDFRREAQSIKRFARSFSDEPDLVVPHVFTIYSTSRVLTEEYMEGIKADNIEEIKNAGLDTLKAARILNHVILRSIFEHRFFHADPHPGNIIVTRDNRIALLDFGAMGRLDAARATYVLRFLVAIFLRDTDGIISVLHDTELAPARVDEVSLKNHIAGLLDVYLEQTLGTLDVGRLLSDVFEVTRYYGIKPPPDLLLVGKALTTAEHLGTLLDPGFNPVKQIKPYLLKQYIRHITNPLRYIDAVVDASESWMKLLAEAPKEIRTLMQNLNRDKLLFNVSDTDLDRKLSHQNKLLNRAIISACGLLLFSLGATAAIFKQPGIHSTVSWLLCAAGALLLFFTWLAIRRSGGA